MRRLGTEIKCWVVGTKSRGLLLGRPLPRFIFVDVESDICELGVVE